MDRMRLDFLFSDAELPSGPVDATTSATPSQRADDLLASLGVTAEEAKRIEDGFSEKRGLSPTALALGVGFTAWSIAEAGPILHHGIEAGVAIGTFIIDNLDVLTAGWESALPAIAEFAVEFALHIPGGTLELGMNILDLLSHADTLNQAVHLALDLGVGLGDALEAVAAGADVVDLAEGITTLGLSMLVSWGAGKAVEKYYEPKIREKAARLEALKQQYLSLLKLRQALHTELPSTVLSGELRKLPSEQWAF